MWWQALQQAVFHTHSKHCYVLADTLLVQMQMQQDLSVSAYIRHFLPDTGFVFRAEPHQATWNRVCSPLKQFCQLSNFSNLPYEG